MSVSHPPLYSVHVCLTCGKQVNFHEKCCDRHPERISVVDAAEAENLRRTVGVQQKEIDWLTDQVERFRDELGLPPL